MSVRVHACGEEEDYFSLFHSVVASSGEHLSFWKAESSCTVLDAGPEGIDVMGME